MSSVPTAYREPRAPDQVSDCPSFKALPIKSGLPSISVTPTTRHNLACQYKLHSVWPKCPSKRCPEHQELVCAAS